jgi:probable F420-dependent oxidoreductase
MTTTGRLRSPAELWPDPNSAWGPEKEGRMRVFTTLPQEDLRRVAPAAREIEADGYDGVHSMENKHDPFLALAVAGTVTERIELHTSVAIAFARSPMVVANVGWDLAGATGGRFVTGLGSQVRGHNERRFSVPWTPPAPRMREYIQALRAIWRCWKTGERLGYEGQHYRFTLMTPNFAPEPIDAPPPAVTIAAVGPAMLKVAAEECDGVKLHGFCTRKYLEQAVMPRLAEGLAKTGRRRDNFEISGGGFLATGPDDATVAQMFEWVRTRVAFYGSTPAYFPVLALHGLDELGHKLHAMTRQGRWNEMAAEIADDVVYLFAAVGRYDEIADAIAKRYGGLTDALNARATAALPGHLPRDLIQDIRRIPHPFSGFKVANV